MQGMKYRTAKTVPDRPAQMSAENLLFGKGPHRSPGKCAPPHTVAASDARPSVNSIAMLRPGALFHVKHRE